MITFPSSPTNGQIFEASTPSGTKVYEWDASKGYWKFVSDVTFNALDRDNHVGTQPIATVTGLQSSLDGKQEILVSTSNIKTVGGTSILGSGDIPVDLLIENTPVVNNYTIQVSDKSKVVATNSASPLVITVPTNAVSPFPIGSVVTIYNMNEGVVEVVGDTGVDVRNAREITSQYGEASLRKRGTDEWVMI